MTRKQLEQIIKEELEAELLEPDLEEGVFDYVRNLFRKKKKGGDIMSAPTEYSPGDFRDSRPSDYDRNLTYQDDLRADQEQKDRVSFGLMRGLSKNISFIADRSRSPEQYIRILQRMLRNIKGLHATDKKFRIQSAINFAKNHNIEQIRDQAKAMVRGDEGKGYPKPLSTLKRPAKNPRRITKPELQIDPLAVTQASEEASPQLPDTQILPTQSMPQLPDTQILPKTNRTKTEKLRGKPISRRARNIAQTRPLYNPPKR